MTSYSTIARDARVEIEVKRSRFVCTLARVSSEPAARAVVDAVRKEHWDAGHHCTAFVLGAGAEVERSSDDGEPAGTAGAPMLEVLRGREVSDTVAVVSRWFGGVLLGAGGLVRAYGDAVRAGLDSAGLLARELAFEYVLSLDHAVAGRVESGLRSAGVSVLDASYGERVTLLVGVAPASCDSFTASVAALTGGSVLPERVGERWVDVESSG